MDLKEYERVLREGKGFTDYFPVKVTNIKWEDGSTYPNEAIYPLGDFVVNYDGHPNRCVDFHSLIKERLEGDWGRGVAGFDIRGELAKRGKPEGKHFVERYWNGDSEFAEYYAFKTEGEAMAFVAERVTKMAGTFDREWKNHNQPKTSIDLENLVRKLLTDGEATCLYCQNESWRDRWFYWERD